MIKYKKTLGEASIEIEFETVEQLIEYVRLENEPEELVGVTANENADRFNNFMGGCETTHCIRKNGVEIKNSIGDTVGLSMGYKIKPIWTGPLPK